MEDEMSTYLAALQTNFKDHALPTVQHAAQTALGTWGISKAAARPVEWLAFEMPLEALALGSSLTALGGNAASVLGKTFAADQYKQDAVKVLTFALGAGFAAYFAPKAAALVAVELTAEMGYALGAVSVLQYVATLFISKPSTTKPAVEDKRDDKAIIALNDKEAAELSKKIADKEVTMTDKTANATLAARAEVAKAGFEWNAKLFDKVVADNEKKVAELYGMIHPGELDNLTIRSVFIIGPDKKIKLIMTYPASTGRNFLEILRALDSIQLTAKHKVATPVDWKHGDDCIIVPGLSDEEAKDLFPNGWNALKSYLRLVPDPSKK